MSTGHETFGLRAGLETGRATWRRRIVGDTGDHMTGEARTNTNGMVYKSICMCNEKRCIIISACGRARVLVDVCGCGMIMAYQKQFVTRLRNTKIITYLMYKTK